jgi:nucleotide-binding universal stress UspA family protein
MLPPRSIIAAVDFSEPSRTALVMAARLAQACGAALRVLHAEDPLLQAAAVEANVDLTTETRDELRRFIDAAPPASELQPPCDVVSGPPAVVIVEIARREGADLIVVGSHGMSGAGRLLFGSVTEGVLRRADRSVLVVPAAWTPHHPDAPGLAGVGPLVVGVDFSESSLRAVSEAGVLARQLQTSVEALHVVPDLSVTNRWRAYAERVTTQQLDLARRELARLTGASTSPIPVAVRVEQGRIAEQLAAGAAPIGSRHPILVLGRRREKSRTGTPGATAYRVANLARVPVLMHED